MRMEASPVSLRGFFMVILNAHSTTANSCNIWFDARLICIATASKTYQANM